MSPIFCVRSAPEPNADTFTQQPTRQIIFNQIRSKTAFPKILSSDAIKICKYLADPVR